MATWTYFEEAGRSPSGKTRRWTVHAKLKGEILGIIQWWPAWRKYVFQPAYPTVFEEVCLRDIAAFVAEESKRHRDQRLEGEAS